MTDVFRNRRIFLCLGLVAAVAMAGCAQLTGENPRGEIAVAALRHRFREAPYNDTITVWLELRGIDAEEVISQAALGGRQIVLRTGNDVKTLKDVMRKSGPDDCVGWLHLSINHFSAHDADVFMRCEWESAVVTYDLKLEKTRRGWEVIKETLDDVE